LVMQGLAHFMHILWHILRLIIPSEAQAFCNHLFLRIWVWSRWCIIIHKLETRKYCGILGYGLRTPTRVMFCGPQEWWFAAWIVNWIGL
jgi:hypothetical protein